MERFYNGDKLEVVLKPTDNELQGMIDTARSLMLKKMDEWILDRLTIEQLENCIKQFQAEIEKRHGLYNQTPPKNAEESV